MFLTSASRMDGDPLKINVTALIHQLCHQCSPLQLWPLLALVEASLMLASLWAGVRELLNSSAV